MSEIYETNQKHNEHGFYEIQIKGHLDDRWSDWFGGMTITLEENGNSLLTGPLVDQAALHGLLKIVRDLGMPLVSVVPVEPRQSNEAGDPTVKGAWLPGKEDPN